MKKIIYLILLVALVITGCKKSYLDINVNPNQPTEGLVTPDLILPQALHTTAAQVGAGYSSLARWMGYWTRGGDFGPNAEEETYNITTSFGAGNYNNWYNNLFDYNVIQQKANASGQTFYEGIAITMKTVGFMNLVDMYNNVPYSKAFDLANNIQPAYDKGEDIYKDLFLQLDKALVLIDQAQPGRDINLVNADIMFKGNKTLWKKLINTQRLKLVVRLSQVNTVNPVTELAKVSSEGFLGAGETAAVNPGYGQTLSGSGESQQNPFWDAYERLQSGGPADLFNRANNYVLGLLRNNGDIRFQYYFDPAQTPLNGNTYFGYDYGFFDTDPNLPKSVNSSGVAGPGLSRSPSQSQWFFTSVESLFLQAEAIQRGWIAGNARTAYEDAIRESFAYLGVPNSVAVANAYINSGNPIVDWAGATSDAAKVNLIVQQKYLGLVGINNFEAWVDYRRVGVPSTLPLSRAVNRGPNIPVRYRYPQREYDVNAAAVNAEGNPDPFTSTIFWDR